MESIPIIVSAVLLCILLPTVAYIFINTLSKDDFTRHAESDEANMREIRGSIGGLSTKMDENFRSTITMIRANGNSK